MTSKFDIKIESTDENGLIHASINLLEFEVNSTDGQNMAVLYEIPENKLTAAVTIDEKGNFTYDDKIQLVLTKYAHFLIKNDTVIQPANVFSEVDLLSNLQFSASDGKLINDQFLKTDLNLTQVKTRIKEQDPVIDVIPYDYFRSFLMPSNSISKNESIVEKQDGYNVLITADVIGQEKVLFSSSLFYEDIEAEKNNSYNLQPIRLLESTEVFDLEQGILLSIKGTSVSKQSTLSKEIKQQIKLTYIPREEQ